MGTQLNILHEMSTRAVVQVFSAGEKLKVVGETQLPGVFAAPIRSDVVHHVYRDMAKNKRQAYAVHSKAGHQVAAISWGTGRAVSRIPRVNGGGTHRAGQGAYGNMCRGGRMFAPTKVWRRWSRKIAKNQRRYAAASGIAASGIAPLVMARGHEIGGVPEVPLVVSEEIEAIKKTKDAVATLKNLGAYNDVDRAKNSRTIRAGKGKARNRRYVQRRGPLVVYHNDNGIRKAFRNIAGVDVVHVDSLSILDLAPGGHLGRFIVWTQPAFERLNDLWGSSTQVSKIKKNYRIPRSLMSNSDISRIISSEEIQSVISAPKPNKNYSVRQKKNPLKNMHLLAELNPYMFAKRRQTIRAQRAGRKPIEPKAKAKLSAEQIKARRAAKKAFVRNLHK